MQRRVRFDRYLLMQRMSGGQFQGARRRFSVRSLPNGLLLIKCWVNGVHDVRGWDYIAQGQQRRVRMPAPSLANSGARRSSCRIPSDYALLPRELYGGAAGQVQGSASQTGERGVRM